MRERAFTSSIIWIALAVSIDRILNSVSEFTTSAWQFGAGFLIFVLILCAMGATIAIWQSAAGKVEQSAQAQSEKAKRDNRDARIKRLLASMDDDDLDVLERGAIDSEGERLSLEALLRKRD